MSRLTRATRKMVKVVKKYDLDAGEFKDVTKRVREKMDLKVQRPKQRIDIDHHSEAEIEKLIETAYGISEDRGVMLRTMYESAMRVTAFCNLRVQDVLLEDRKIHARNTKGNKARLIPISDEMTDVLREYIGDRTGPLFPSQNGGHYSRRRMQQIITDIGKKAGMKCYPHKLRKSRAMWLLRQKMPLPAISQLLGHSDTSVTESFYARMGVSMVADELDQVYQRLELVQTEHRRAA